MVVVNRVHTVSYDRMSESGFEIRSQSREKFRLSPFCITSSGKPSFLLGCVVRSEAVPVLFIQFLRNFSPARNDPRPDLRTTPENAPVPPGVYRACGRWRPTRAATMWSKLRAPGQDRPGHPCAGRQAPTGGVAVGSLPRWAAGWVVGRLGRCLGAPSTAKVN